MSTKNMSRTIIEGGRHKRYKEIRKGWLRSERRKAREFCNQVADDPELFEEKPRRPKKQGGWDAEVIQKDKLRPLDRWLEKQAGRPWDDVYSELKEKFDERTIKGYHLLNDHVRGAINGIGEETWPFDPEKEWPGRWRMMYVDTKGILRKCKTYTKPRRDSNIISKKEQKKICSFLGKRKIRRTGQALTWVEPIGGDAVRAFFGAICYTRPRFSYFRDEKLIKTLNWSKQVDEEWVEPMIGSDGRLLSEGYHKPIIKGASFRAGSKLSNQELEEWNSFSQVAQQFMLERSGWTKFQSKCKFCGELYEHSSQYCHLCNRYQ